MICVLCDRDLDEPLVDLTKKLQQSSSLKKKDTNEERLLKAGRAAQRLAKKMSR